MYVISRYSNLVSVVDMINKKESSVFAIQEPIEIAVNSVTNMIYVVTHGALPKYQS